MKKNLMYSLMGLGILILFSMFFSSCNRALDVQQVYPFKVQRMPIPKDIKKGETVEIRCHLSAEGEYAKTAYRMRYFQYDGEGTLHLLSPKSEALKMNDYYAVPYGDFRLYYTSHTEEQQMLEIVFEDNQQQEQIMEINFKNKTIKNENQKN